MRTDVIWSRARIALPLITLMLMPVAARAAMPRVGLEVAGLEGMLTMRGAPSLDDPAMRLSWSAGGITEWPLGPRWSFGAGLGYLRHHEDQDISLSASGAGSTTTIRGNETTDWQWIALPLRIAFRPRAPWVLEAGPEVRYLVSARMRSRILQTTTTTTPGAGWGARTSPTATIFEDVGTFGGDHDVTGSFARVDVALTVGAGLERSFGGHLVSVCGRYAHGLPDLAKGDLERRTRAAALTLGWRW